MIVSLGITPLYAQKSKKGRKSRVEYSSEQRSEAFVRRMNTNAKLFGMTNTNFRNASGIVQTNHYSTASDMLRLLIAATSYDKLMLYWSFESFNIEVMGDKILHLRNETTNRKR